MNKFFIDCGANLGQSALAFRELLGQEKFEEFIVYCFEPSKKIYSKLQENTSSFTNIICSPQAAWVSDGTIDFFDTGNESSTTETTKINTRTDKTTLISAESIDLSRFIEELPKPNYVYLKIDIEGGEYRLFKHLKQTGSLKNIDCCLIELHAVKMSDKSIQDDFEIIDILEEFEVKTHTWDGNSALKNKKFGQIYNKDLVIKEWKRKGRYK
jgi:FkbM family methyltransferase